MLTAFQTGLASLGTKAPLSSLSLKYLTLVCRFLSSPRGGVCQLRVVIDCAAPSHLSRAKARSKGEKVTNRYTFPAGFAATQAHIYIEHRRYHLQPVLDLSR